MSQLTEIENPNVPPIGARVVKVSLKYKKQTMEDLASSCVEDLAYRSVVGTNDPKEISVVIHPEPTSVKDGRGASIHCDRVIKTRFGPRKTDGLFFAYSPTLEISLESGHHIRATPGHKLYTGERWVECEALRVGDVLQLESGFSSIKSIQTHPDKTIVVDVCVPGPHEYIGNGIVSHNSILEQISWRLTSL
jgi:hypothetical protein